SSAAPSVYSAFVRVQPSRFFATYSRSGKAVGEEQRELALRARPRVRAVHDVLGELEREVTTDRAGRRVERIRRAHHRPDDRDRGLATDGEREHGSRADEVDERAEERLALVFAVVLSRRRLRDLQQAGGPELEPSTLEAGDDLPGEPPAHAVGLDEDQCRLAGHAAA